MENLAKGDWSDPKQVQEFATTYHKRYGPLFWKSLTDILPERSFRNIADFGCGPGIWLADAITRFDAPVAYGLDASQAMLDYANEILRKIAGGVKYTLHLVDFDQGTIPLPISSVDLGFSGFMLHEVADARKFTVMVLRHINTDGVFVVYDFISGNPEEFIRQMAKLGISEERARMRYPHMCKHSLSDIEAIMKNAGFSSVSSKKILDTRAVVVAVKST